MKRAHLVSSEGHLYALRLRTRFLPAPRLQAAASRQSVSCLCGCEEPQTDGTSAATLALGVLTACPLAEVAALGVWGWHTLRRP